VQDIFNNQGLPSQIADQFVANKLAEAKKYAEKLAKKEPQIGTNIAQYKEAMAQWQQDQATAQANVAFGEEVQQLASQATIIAEEQPQTELTKEVAEEQPEARPTAEETSATQTPTETTAEEAPVIEAPQVEQPAVEVQPTETEQPQAEFQQTADEIVADTPAAQLATEATIKALTRPDLVDLKDIRY